MSKFLFRALVALLLLSLSAGVSMAAGVSIGVSNNSVFGDHVVGIGAGVNLPFNGGHQQFNVDGRYEFGNYKEEDDGPPPTTYEEKVSGFRVRAGVDHVIMMGAAHVFLGSGFSFASHKFKFDFTGSPEVESDPYSVFGVNSRFGAAGPISEGSNVWWFGQFENTFGWGSVDDSGTKYTQNDNTNGFQGGILIHFGESSAN